MTLKEKGLNDLGDIKYKTKWYPNGMTTQAMYLTVMHRPEDNGLDFSFEHQSRQSQESSLSICTITCAKSCSRVQKTLSLQ